MPWEAIYLIQSVSKISNNDVIENMTRDCVNKPYNTRIVFIGVYFISVTICALNNCHEIALS